jgi:hypothetical protein
MTEEESEWVRHGTYGPNHIPPPYDIWGKPYTKETFLRWRAMKDNNRAQLLERLMAIEKEREEILGKLKYFEP